MLGKLFVAGPRSASPPPPITAPSRLIAPVLQVVPRRPGGDTPHLVPPPPTQHTYCGLGEMDARHECSGFLQETAAAAVRAAPSRHRASSSICHESASWARPDWATALLLWGRRLVRVALPNWEQNQLYRQASCQANRNGSSDDLRTFASRIRGDESRCGRQRQQGTKCLAGLTRSID